MEIAMGAIGPLLPRLGGLLVGEFTLEKRVRKGIESLLKELTLMHAALHKVAKVPPDQLDLGVKIWAGNVKELSYQMEDIVDTFVVRVEEYGEPAANPKNKVKKLLKKTTRLFKKGRELHRISDALEEAVGQAKQLAELRQRYEQDMGDTGAGASVDPRMIALYTDMTELVGIEDTQDELINMLIEGDDWFKHPLKTVSIVGFGGLGKTTLAKAVYDKIKVQFKCSAFVSVSRNPDMNKTLKDILFEFDKKKYANIYNVSREEKHLIDELIEFLNGKRYLVVIDDIWDKEVWKVIKCAFSKDSLGSRLITTTRILSVSEACSSFCDGIYRMKPLSEAISRRLFYKRVFSHEKGCPQELMQVSQDILKKCGGIPLAIITIASILASDRQIKTRDQWYSLLNSFGRGLTEDRSVEEMNRILLFSYYDLPFYLKPCLLYLSIFPEDYKIVRDELIWRWIAEGFVHTGRQETSLYELGNSYFSELMNRNLIQTVGIDKEERVEACRIHDMVLDLICSLVNEENFVTILEGAKRKVFNSQIKVRRLSIQKGKVDVATTSITQVRSLTVFTKDIVDQVSFISSFQVLRVLDLKGCSIVEIGCVRNLLHLRYLGLKHTPVEELPIEIGRLRFLQTLDIGNTRIKELPSSIVWLRDLMCLKVHRNIKLPSGMDNLTSLEVLGPFVVGQLSSSIFNVDIVKELSHLTKLRVLWFECKGLDSSQDKVLVESLRNLHDLESLDIASDSGCAKLMQEGWMALPKLRLLYFSRLANLLQTLPALVHPSSLPRLSRLSIWVDEVRAEDIRLLGMLPALRSLYMSTSDEVFSGEHPMEMSVVTANAFPCATDLCFFGITAVPSTFPEGAAPRLKHLHFSLPIVWTASGDFDMGMRHLPSLEKIEVVLLLWEASVAKVNKARAAVRDAVGNHPNRLGLRIDYP